MRRSVMVMFMALAALPAMLAAQTRGAPAPAPAAAPAQSDVRPPYKARPHAIGFGFFATLGSYWQMQGLEIGYARRMQRGLAAVSFSGRLGTFINESTMIGGTQGIAFGATLAARTRMKSFAQFGEEEHGAAIGVDMTFEVTGYTAAASPLSRSRWVAISVLPALSVGSGDAARFGIVIGPTAFLGDGKPSVRGMLAFRGEAPLARREPRP